MNAVTPFYFCKWDISKIVCTVQCRLMTMQFYNKLIKFH